MPTAARDSLIAVRTTLETKARFGALAALHGLSPSALLTRILDDVLNQNENHDMRAQELERPAGERLSLRLRPGDLAKVSERAVARGMKTATYIAALIHAHVCRDAPLPVAELNVLKLAVAQLSGLRRDLDRSTGQPSGANADVARALLEATQRQVDDLRRDVAGVVRCNLMSWEAGDA